MTFRIGSGYDVHRLVEGRPLILGGVTIPHDKGLLGHSDADVLLHAMCDAILGAAGLGDIGEHFPDTNPRYKGVSSLELLKSCRNQVGNAGYRIGNVDATLLAQAPKISSFKARMKENIAHALGVSSDRINIKATTTEGLGFEGKKEGIAAQAVVLLTSKP